MRRQEDTLRSLIRETISQPILSEGMKYHIDNGMSLNESIFRFGSKSHLELIKEARTLYRHGAVVYGPDDVFLLETDLGEFGTYMGRSVPLDLPFEDDSLNEAEYQGRKIQLNKPRRGGEKSKFFVYTRNEKGKVVKVGFGQPGVKIKTQSPARRKSFLARHNCDTPGPRWKARWWSCNLHRYKKQLGLNFKGRW